ncbi:MAG: hypothetical protein PHY64_01360 [Eubacteriales bacterium]|nr:hypothetical protein [Eubacteriales bacterium]
MEFTSQAPTKISPVAYPIEADLAKFLYELGEEANYIVGINGETYSRKALQRLPKYEPLPAETVKAFTLDGLCDWLKQDIDRNFNAYPKLMIAVESPTRVCVYSPVSGVEGNRRVKLAECNYCTDDFRWGSYMDQEMFVTFLLSRFAESENRSLVGRLVGNIRQETSAEAADDGVSQRITVKNGIAKIGETIVKNPVYLEPMRTFTEIAQPSSPFVLRVKEGPQIALYEADGGAWKNVAVIGIKEYLDEMLDGLNVIVIA